MTASVRKTIRKALEAPLGPALIAGEVTLPWEDTPTAALMLAGLTLDRTDEKLLKYVRFSVHFAPQRVQEIGPTPRTLYQGLAVASVYTRSYLGHDPNDTIAGIIEAAYPYNALLTRDGLSVIIAETNPRDPVEDGAWWVADTVINWSLWRQL